MLQADIACQQPFGPFKASFSKAASDILRQIRLVYAIAELVGPDPLAMQNSSCAAQITYLQSPADTARHVYDPTHMKLTRMIDAASRSGNQSTRNDAFVEQLAFVSVLFLPARPQIQQSPPTQWSHTTASCLHTYAVMK